MTEWLSGSQLGNKNNAGVKLRFLKEHNTIFCESNMLRVPQGQNKCWRQCAKKSGWTFSGLVPFICSCLQNIVMKRDNEKIWN